MKKLIIRSLLMIALSTAANGQDWTASMADKWFSNMEWLGGLKLQPHESINRLEFAVQYHKNKALWDKAFDFLKTNDLEKVAVGKYPLDGDNGWVAVSEYNTREFKDARIEAHKKYIDIQYVVRGEEKMGVVPLSKTKISEAYNEAKDVAFYTSSDCKYYLTAPRIFFIFFPDDAHQPCIKTAAGDAVKKVVVKLRVD